MSEISRSMPPQALMRIRYLRASMLLIEWEDRRILTDPWFAMRMRGLPVFVRPAIVPRDLPPLDLILVSHFHPDHFDPRALRKLAEPARLMIGPPGLTRLGRRLPVERLVELNDNEALTEAGWAIHAFAVAHSGYENAYLIERGEASLFFAGDAKYTDVFHKIGVAHRPLVALLPVGGTEALGKRIVMDPADARRAAFELGARVVVPIHRGGEWLSIPPLSRHPGRAEKLVELARSEPFFVAMSPPGEWVTIDSQGRVIASRGAPNSRSAQAATDTPEQITAPGIGE